MSVLSYNRKTITDKVVWFLHDYHSKINSFPNNIMSWSVLILFYQQFADGNHYYLLKNIFEGHYVCVIVAIKSCSITSL